MGNIISLSCSEKQTMGKISHVEEMEVPKCLKATLFLFQAVEAKTQPLCF